MSELVAGTLTWKLGNVGFHLSSRFVGVFRCSHNLRHLFCQLQKDEVRFEDVLFLVPVCHERILRISVRIVEFIGFGTLEIHHGFYSKTIHFNTAHLPLTNCWALTAYLTVQAPMGRVYPHLTGLTGCSNCLGLILPSPSTGKNYCTFFFRWIISLGNMWPLDGAYYSNYPEKWMKLITSVLLVPLFFTMNFCCC